MCMRTRMRVTVVCLSVYVSVCYQSTDCLRGLHNKMNIPADFTLNEDFQLRDFFKRFLSRLTASFVHFSMLKRPLSFLSAKR